MSDTRAEIGRRGESLAADFLLSEGYEIVARNARVGRLEIDLIAHKGGVLVFCEVRSRASDHLMDPIASLDRNKAQRVRKAAAIWMRENEARARELRFDAFSIVTGEGEPKLTHYPAAF